MLRFAMLVCVLATARAPGMAAGDEKQNNSHAHDFVIFADVYSDRGFALPGAKVCARRSDERKFRWEANSDTRDELGVRVKRKIDARAGNREELTIQMEPSTGGKP
jgi:hypothetical protein